MTVPAPAQQRHALMDAGRGFAILGILWLNIFVSALPFEALAIPGIWGDYQSGTFELNVEIWRMVGIFVDGVMRCMISMLFGASALVMMRNAERSGGGIAALDPFFRRLLLLIGFGLIHAYLLLWPYDILYLYGLFGLFLFPFRNLSIRRLTAIAGVLIVLSAIVGAETVSPVEDAESMIEQSLDGSLIEQEREDTALVDQFNDTQVTADDAPDSAGDMPGSPGDEELDRLAQSIADEIMARREGYLSNVVSLASESFDEQTSEVLSHHFLDVVPIMLLGMALLKAGFLSGAWSTRRYAMIATGGFALGWFLGWFASTAFEGGSVAATLSDLLAPYVYEPRRIAFALAHFSWIALVLRTPVLSWLAAALTACGRMALTLYISQSVVYCILFFGFGFALFGTMEHVEIALLALALTVAQLIAAPLYLSVFRQGPLEWLIRRLAHGAMPAATPATPQMRRRDLRQPAE